MRSKVFIPQLIPEIALNRLRVLADVDMFPHVDRVISPEELLKAVKGKNYLYALAEIPFTAEVIDTALPDLKGIAAMYIFPKFVDIKTATKRGIPVTGIPNLLVETTAEFTFALLIGTAWRLAEGDRQLREKQWKQCSIPKSSASRRAIRATESGRQGTPGFLLPGECPESL